MFKMLLVIILLCSLAMPVFARGHSQTLSQQDIDRLTQIKKLTSGVDTETVQQAIGRLQQLPHPDVHLELMHAVARTFVDIVKEQQVDAKPRQAWLLSMIKLNMAYLQFAGPNQNQNTSSLNLLIRYKLKEYLPTNIYTRDGFSVDLG